jgi:hypothetical protein
MRKKTARIIIEADTSYSFHTTTLGDSMNPSDIGQAFLNHTEIAGVRFMHNEYVEILQGKHSAQRGSLVTVLTLEPQPTFIMELESGFDVEVVQSFLRLVPH